MIQWNRFLVLAGVSLLLVGGAAPVVALRAQDPAEQADESTKKEKKRAKRSEQTEAPAEGEEQT